jgi:hypothetical protein
MGPSPSREDNLAMRSDSRRTFLKTSVLLGGLAAAGRLAGSAGPARPPATPARGSPAEAFPDFARDGAWCWFADPRAVALGDALYAGWITSDGSVEIGCCPRPGGVVEKATLHAAYQRNDHANPVLLVLPDQRLMALYSRHNGPEMHARTTLRPRDISAWSPERALELHRGLQRPARRITYPNPAVLAAENNATYLFWRGDTWKPVFSRSTDGGETWSPARDVVMRRGSGTSDRPYVKMTTNGQDRIHLIFTDGHPRNETQNSVYYACYRNNAFFRANGARICGIDDLPFEPEQADRVYDGRTGEGRAWIWDVVADSAGNPAIAYTRMPAETDHRYHHVSWNGRTWDDRHVTPAGGWFPEDVPGKPQREPHYSGGMALDPAAPGAVYVSRPVGGRFEIERWTRAGRGWRTEAITAGSAHHNVRPLVARGRSGRGALLLWMNNARGYTHYTQYGSAIKWAQV